MTMKSYKYESQRIYDSMNTTQFKLKLNIRYDGDIIRWLHGKQNIGESMQGIIKKLIRREIAAEENT